MQAEGEVGKVTIAEEWMKFTVLHNEGCIDEDNCDFCQMWMEWCEDRDKRIRDHRKQLGRGKAGEN